MSEEETDTTIRLPKDLRDKLAGYGNASDSMADVIRKIIRENKLNVMFNQTKKNQSKERETFFLKHTDKDGKIIE